MKKTMTKEGFLELLRKRLITPEEFYDTLAEAGISFDIYTDSDGQIIKPGDGCEFWNNNENYKEKEIFIGLTRDGTYVSVLSNWNYCRKFPAEVWEPVPADDLAFTETNDTWARLVCQVNTNKWAKTRVTNGKLEGVRK